MIIFTKEPTLEFFLLLITVLAGVFVLYKSIRHYQLIRSREYVVIAIVFFNITFYALYRMWREYLSYDRIWLANQDNQFWSLGPIYFFLNTAWGIGIVALLIHVYRLIEWRKRHPVIKGILILFFIEGVLQAFYYSIITVTWFSTQDWWYFSDRDWYKTHLWFLQLWASHFFFRTGTAAVMIYLALLYFLVGLAYLIVKPVIKTRTVETARFTWVFFGFTEAIKWFTWLSFEYEFQFFSSIPFFSEIRSIYVALTLNELLEAISVVALMVLVALYPETLLITEFQLLQAKRLYSLMKAYEKAEKSPFSLIDTEQHLSHYLEGIPPELLEELRPA